jgi:hypothetical protein
LGPAPERLHRQPEAGGGGHELLDLAADRRQPGLLLGVAVGQLGGVEVVADLQVDGVEVVGPQEAQPPLDLGAGEVAGVVPLVDGHARRHAHLPELEAGLVGGGDGGRAADREHGGQDQDGGCPAHRSLPIGNRWPMGTYRQAGPGS